MHMKKKIIPFIAILILIASSLAFVACHPKAETPPSDISRKTESYLAGESDSFAVSLESGVRENVFIADGKATDVGHFAELKIIPLKNADINEISYRLIAGEESLDGSISEGSRGEYVANISVDFTPEKIVVEGGDASSEIDLCNVLEGAISPDDAIKIARETFKEKLDLEASEGKTREVYLKLISGDRENYYYYVSFIGDGVNYLAALITPDGKIASKRA